MVTDDDFLEPSDTPGLELPKSPTGITGCDEVSNGGVPSGRATLVSGPPGSGKTLFALQLLVARAPAAGPSRVAPGLCRRPRTARGSRCRR